MSKWIRLDVEWGASEWLDDLGPEARLAWIGMLCYAKGYGVKGRIKRSFNRMARVTDVTRDALAAMEEAAIGADALSVDVDGYWVITNWEKYQGDPTSIERKRRSRATSRSVTRDMRPVTTTVDRDKDSDSDSDIDSDNQTNPVVSGPPAEIVEPTNLVDEHRELVVSNTDARKEREALREDFAKVVWMYWVDRTGKDPKRTKWDDKRKRRLCARLKENDNDVAELLCVVDGAIKDPFHRGANDRGTEYLQIQTIFRDREMVEKLALASPHYGKPVHPFMDAREAPS